MNKNVVRKKNLIAFVRSQGVTDGKTFNEIMRAYKNEVSQWGAYGRNFSFNELGSHFYIWTRLGKITESIHA